MSHTDPRAVAKTRVELLREAIEDFTNATIDARMCDDDINTKAEIDEINAELMYERNNLTAKLEAFMAPIVRLVDTTPQPYALGTADEDKPLCHDCKRHFPCGVANCQGWRKALRRKRMEVEQQQAIPDIPA
jgi:hypothetical protein